MSEQNHRIYGNLALLIDKLMGIIGYRQIGLELCRSRVPTIFHLNWSRNDRSEGKVDAACNECTKLPCVFFGTKRGILGEVSMAFDLNCLTCGQMLELENLIG